MGTELVGPCIKDDSMEIPSIPPGFESLVPFTLKRSEDNQVGSYSSSGNAFEKQTVKTEVDFDSNDDLKATKSITRRVGIKYSQFDYSSGDEHESQQVQHVLRHQLPKGIIRGCESCKNCQKVTANWRPEEARRPDLEAAPVFYPSEEEFEDTLKYISSIRAKAEIYGICRIVPPRSWKPPCPLKEREIWEKSKFATRVQRIDKLQNRNTMRKILQVNHNKKRKKRRCMKNGLDNETNNEEIKIPDEFGLHEADRFGFEPGSEFTLDAFQIYADDFKVQYFRGNNSSESGGNGSVVQRQDWQPSVENIEGEYWRMVEKPTDEIEVLYGADLETGVFGSGFPKTAEQVSSDSDIKYINSGWNLNNFPRLPGSVLSFESSDISGVLVPWLYIGMCFSSFCWHVEDHHLYSLNYMHWGAPKLWYGVPGSDALKLEAAMKKHLPDLFDEQPDLLHKLVTQLSPSILRSEGVPVYRCVQNAGEFVLTLPRAYHAGFNSGFNCAEAVNVAPVDWLPHGHNVIELYREQGRKTSISHDKLLLGAAREAVKANWEYNLLRKSTANNLRWRDVCGKDGVLSKALKARVETERVRREFLSRSSTALKMESTFDATSERECSVCLFDLHLSAAGCHHCSPDKYACLNHAKQLCSCSWGAKFFLFRYDINELNILVEALEGKLSAVYRWARLDLGLSLSSYVSGENKQLHGVSGKLSHASQGSAGKEMGSQVTALYSKEQKGKADGAIPNHTKNVGSPNSSPNSKPPVVVLALQNMKETNSSSQKAEVSSPSLDCKKENSLQLASRYKALSNQLPSTKENLALEKHEGNQLSCPGSNEVVLLSDDDAGSEPSEEPSVVKEASEKHTVGIQKQVCRENIGSGHFLDKPASATVAVNHSAMLERMKNGSGLEGVKVEHHAKGETCPDTSPHSSPCFKISMPGKGSSRDVPRKETPKCSDANVDGGHKPQQIYEEKSCNGDSKKSGELIVDSGAVDNSLTVPCNQSGSPNILDRYYRQKGPRIAKVVRRINCNVEPMDYGAVCAEKLWCDSRAIYPKGFRSRVRYIDVTDPSNMCYYVSQILDAGQSGPLFMVSVEHCPSEVYFHVSAARCWELVRDRVNQEIARQHKLGRQNLPPLQPPGSLDGMEMFGFSSPAIVQAIQALDHNRVCSDYWRSRPLMQIPQQSQYAGSSSVKSEDDEGRKRERHAAVEKILDGLLKKASSEELQTLYSITHNKNPTSEEQSLLNRLLNDAIHKHPL
ncbi:putative lysine-specific demethylase JMJ16 isoform X1 [Salvia splendens]|uniref:putative lysine-specific demethylase JMJ16 isoform X1 n=1 Tax=Salvia splendens TaxID=180675 RepID=UPI001C27B60F|nr:putative lysine-specific demethylase JMJ16 isoform X1 [Salvia splendens]XP_042054001.1 putative lysine-specific demethylase JMJ16 isoform X1 [Salvia splendens]XP_042054002.1 putative lysine-specific demethylase JMJ16 isoform X1 [Salvia splendens]XP_042054003.1 putative lysine-specific demethylase JMJ16 isoform X1 [Salvia splendens]XP_042054004.1 putative lysine-specific demethylase JMJ16 isoform X1 [Salvia splendens]XP_042054005.1 putative lysine-specific demethylase JMJ16 isoform X1 [Salvi